MYNCPLCNGLREIVRGCPKCNEQMSDQGRYVDFLGDYIPYLDYEGTKLVDGNSKSTTNHECVHLFYCQNCEEQLHIAVQEIRK